MHWDEVADVIVVGTGCAGCSAAASAMFHGAKSVILAEKSLSLVGGTTKLAGGGWLWCPNNKFLREKGVKQTSDEILDLLIEFAYPKDEGVQPDPGDVELMRTFATEWPTIVDTLLEEKIMDLRLVQVREDEDAERVYNLLLRKEQEQLKNDYAKKTGITDANRQELSRLMPSYCAEHILDLCPSGKVLAPDGGTTSLQLEKSAKRLGASLRKGYHVIDIIFNQDKSRVIGAIVSYTAKKGEIPKVLRIQATKGVIFASGGFSHNKVLMEQYFGGKELAPQGTCAAKTNTGDLIEISDRHGIPTSGLDLAWLKQIVLPYKFPERIGVFFLNGDSFIVVDRTGKRFANDRMFYQQRGMQMLKNPERRCVFFVYDARAGELFDGPIKGLGGPIPMQNEGMFEDCEIRGSNEQELMLGVSEKLAKVAPGFELDPKFSENLKAQIERFNSMAINNGIDYEFGRGEDVAQYCWSVPRAKDNKLRNKTMFPIDQKNLRCVILGLSTLDTKGGPRIASTAHIKDKNDRPIQGLFGAGNCVRSPTRYSYPASGVTMAYGVLFGWIAGREALKTTISNSKL